MTDYPTNGEPVVFNMLWSYVYARKIDLTEFLPTLQVPHIRFFADSGAHSARTLGIHLDVHQYAQWVKANEKNFTIYCNLDVIGAPRQTRENQNIMEQEYGLSPMPVFHTGEDFSVLEKYIEDGYTYIALGKLLGNSKKALKPWLAKAFHVAGDRAVFHGFGLTVWEMLVSFPFYSVDSSSWGAAFRYGQLRLFDNGRWASIKLRDRNDVLTHRALIKSYGLPIAALTKNNQNTPLLAKASAESVRRSNLYLRNLHGKVHLPEGKGYPSLTGKTNPPVLRSDPTGLHTAQPGLNAYLASGPPADFPNAAPAYRDAAQGTGTNIYLADTVKHQFLRAASAFNPDDQGQTP